MLTRLGVATLVLGWASAGAATALVYDNDNPLMGISGPGLGEVIEFSATPTSINGEVVFANVAPIDFQLPLMQSQTNPVYSVTATVTNQTDRDWIDFHLRLGYGTGAEFDVFTGLDTPIFLSEVTGTFPTVQMLPAETPEPGETDNPEVNNGNPGFDLSGATVPVGQSFSLAFLFWGENIQPETQFDADYFIQLLGDDSFALGIDSGGETVGQLLTIRAVPSVSESPTVPEPISAGLAWLALGAAGWAATRRRP